MADRFRSQRMQKRWTQITGSTFGMTVNATFAGGGLDFTEAQTVLRMLGEYILVPTSIPTAGDHGTYTVGIGIVSSDAFALGSTAMPDPITEPDFPWLYWASHDVLSRTAEQDPSSPGAALRHSFDIRSMRKVKPRETLVFVGQWSIAAGAPEWTAGNAPVRVLVAE